MNSPERQKEELRLCKQAEFFNPHGNSKLITQNSLYLFNPDHDMALANSDVNYMPPAAARQFAVDMAIFPAWYADEDSNILASSPYNKSFLDQMRLLFPSLPQLITEVEIAEKDYLPVPWGWNPALCKKLSNLGIPQSHLPTAARLNAIRKASHRMLAVELLSKLTVNSYYCGSSVYLTDINELRHFVQNNNPCILKAPLSGSGKGLNWCKGTFTFHIEHWCGNVLKQQGGVVAEPLYNKIIDFAMQFRADADGELTFTGYSLFETNASGAYVGNILTSDASIETRLTRYISVESLEATRQSIIKELNGVFAGVYTGYFGVDMMICKFDDEPRYRLHPCVEINLRMNMGMASRLIYDRYVHPGSTGKLKIEYYSSADELKKETSALKKKYPLSWVDGKICSGYFPLIPVKPDSRYHTWLQINVNFPDQSSHT